MNASGRLPEMVGAKEIAERLGVTARTVNRWKSRGMLPAPAFNSRKVCRWKLADVVAALGGPTHGGY